MHWIRYALPVRSFELQILTILARMDESRHLTAECAKNSEKFAVILGELCDYVENENPESGEKMPL